MSQPKPSAAEEKATKAIAAGDDYFGKNKFSEARSQYDEALKALMGEFGHVHICLAPVLEKLVDAYYQAGAENSSDNRKAISKYLKMLVTIKQMAHGTRSAEVIPALEKLVVFYDFDGAHMLAIEVLQRIDDIKANLEVGQV